jgi:hypothetical protein
MLSKNSLLATLGSLAFGTVVLATSPAAAAHKLHEYRCEEIRKLTNIDALLKIVRLHDACSPVALQRIVDLTRPAAGPVVAGGGGVLADAS